MHCKPAQQKVFLESMFTHGHPVQIYKFDINNFKKKVSIIFFFMFIYHASIESRNM